MEAHSTVVCQICQEYTVIHPLDDVKEEKVNLDNLGPLPMTRTTRLTLIGLRAYLLVMGLVVLWKVIALAN